MDARCWRRLASMAAVLVPRPARNPWRVSWKEIADVSLRLRKLAIAFQRTLTSPIHWKPPFPFVTRTNICHVNYSASVPSWNSACTMTTTSIQLVASGESSHIAAISHWRRCSTYVPEGMTERFRQSLRTAQAISSFSGMESSTNKGKVGSPTGIGYPGDGTCQ